MEAEGKAPSAAKLKALFGLFDAFGIGKAKKEDFAKIVAQGRPLNTIQERLKLMLNKGGHRLQRLLLEEF